MLLICDAVKILEDHYMLAQWTCVTPEPAVCWLYCNSNICELLQEFLVDFRTLLKFMQLQERTDPTCTVNAKMVTVICNTYYVIKVNGVYCSA